MMQKKAQKKQMPVWAAYIAIIVSVVLLVGIWAFLLVRRPVSDEIPTKPIRQGAPRIGTAVSLTGF